MAQYDTTERCQRVPTPAVTCPHAVARALLCAVHYLTKTGRVKEAVSVLMCLRRDGVMVARGRDADGNFVLAGTYKPPNHMSAQVRRHACAAGVSSLQLVWHASYQ